jgi:hypothetical protein
MNFRKSNPRGSLIEVSPEGSRDYESQSHMLSKTKDVMKYVAIGAGVLAAMAGLYSLDRNIQEADTELYKQHFTNALLHIPAAESQHNYRDAQTMEDEAWTFIRRARQGEFRASVEQLDNLAKLLNDNNTVGSR